MACLLSMSIQSNSPLPNRVDRSVAESTRRRCPRNPATLTAPGAPVGASTSQTREYRTKRLAIGKTKRQCCVSRRMDKQSGQR